MCADIKRIVAIHGKGSWVRVSVCRKYQYLDLR